MPRLLALTTLCLTLSGCAFVLDFDGFEVGEDTDGGGLDGGTSDAGDAMLPDGFVPDGCEPEAEVCDGIDNDCNGNIDEAGFANDDPEHCGACGIACAAGYGCVDGFCRDEARDLAAGEAHTCVALKNGEVWCFGANVDGQVGIGSTTERESEPTRVSITGLANGVGAGAAHSCHVGDTTECWGRNEAGQLADNSSTSRSAPVPTMNDGNALEIVGGEAHTCVRTTTDVRCAGSNEFGQLGDALTLTDRSRFAPTMTLLSTAVDIAAGDNHTCVVLSGGDVRCWGDNSRGQLGVNRTTSESGVPVTAGVGTEASRIAAGGDHTCAITVGGGVSCWGSNSDGQLGIGAGADRDDPQALTLDATAVAIAAGGSHTCVVAGDAANARGVVYCWGSNSEGQLGTGDTMEHATPKQVPMVEHALPIIAAGGAHTCVVERIPFGGGPEVRCWGHNESGQLGIGAGLSRSTQPVSAHVPPE